MDFPLDALSAVQPGADGYERHLELRLKYKRSRLPPPGPWTLVLQ